MSARGSGSPLSADCVVVGGGLVGTALAYELACRGRETVLVDRQDPGRATDAGAGILSPETSLDPDPCAHAMGMAAARHYEELVSRLAGDGVSEVGVARTGSLLIAERPGEDEVMDAAVRLVCGRSPGVEEVSPDEARRRVPILGSVRRAVFNPDGRRVDGRVLRAALEAAAKRHGVRVVRTSATGVERGREEGVVVAVRTEASVIETAAVALAGGAWTGELSAALSTRIPVAPLKGQIVHLRLGGADTSAWPIVQPLMSFYLVPWPDGRIACGGTMEAGAGFDHRVTADGVLQLLREALRTAPDLAAAELLEVRVGSRPAAVDGVPILGRVPGWRNVVVATGHGAEGLLLGPLSARLAADLLDGSRAAEGDGREAGVLQDPAVAQGLERWSPRRFLP